MSSHLLPVYFTTTKYNRKKKKEIAGYYYDYDGKETILYKDE